MSRRGYLSNTLKSMGVSFGRMRFGLDVTFFFGSGDSDNLTCTEGSSLARLRPVHSTDDSH